MECRHETESKSCVAAAARHGCMRSSQHHALHLLLLSPCRWSTTGALYLSNIRLVFVADKADVSGLAGFDMPLAYICKEKLNQPIFGCNNLAGVQGKLALGRHQ